VVVGASVVVVEGTVVEVVVVGTTGTGGGTWASVVVVVDATVVVVVVEVGRPGNGGTGSASMMAVVGGPTMAVAVSVMDVVVGKVPTVIEASNTAFFVKVAWAPLPVSPTVIATRTKPMTSLFISGSFFLASRRVTYVSATRRMLSD